LDTARTFPLEQSLKSRRNSCELSTPLQGGAASEFTESLVVSALR